MRSQNRHSDDQHERSDVAGSGNPTINQKILCKFLNIILENFIKSGKKTVIDNSEMHKQIIPLQEYYQNDQAGPHGQATMFQNL